MENLGKNWGDSINTVPIERRVARDERRRVADMSPGEMRRLLLTSEVTGLPNLRAFDEAGTAPPVAMSDLDSLKALNDYGYSGGNAFLRAKADVLREAGLEAYHDKGDEFLCRGSDSAEMAMGKAIKMTNRADHSGTLENLSKRQADALENLSSLLADSICELSDDEILDEVREGGTDPEEYAERTRAVLLQTVQTFDSMNKSLQVLGHAITDWQAREGGFEGKCKNCGLAVSFSAKSNEIWGEASVKPCHAKDQYVSQKWEAAGDDTNQLSSDIVDSAPTANTAIERGPDLRTMDTLEDIARGLEPVSKLVMNWCDNRGSV